MKKPIFNDLMLSYPFLNKKIIVRHLVNRVPKLATLANSAWPSVVGAAL